MIKLLDILQEIEGDTDDVKGKVIKGFTLKPYTGSYFFGNKEDVFTTTLNRPTPQLEKEINNWIIKNFPNSKVRIKFDGTYKTLNFILTK
jgi:hypothetical protein